MSLDNLKRVLGKTRMSFIILQSISDRKLVCAEIGVLIGDNARDMLFIDQTMELHLIDSYDNIGVTDDLSHGSKETVKQRAKDNLAAYSKRVKFVYKQSEQAYRDYPDEFFDYIYIDGDHSYEGAKRDMKLWWPKVKKGGIFAGHDIVMESVNKALDEFAKENNIEKVGKLPYPPESDWWIFKL